MKPNIDEARAVLAPFLQELRRVVKIGLKTKTLEPSKLEYRKYTNIQIREIPGGIERTSASGTPIIKDNWIGPATAIQTTLIQSEVFPTTRIKLAQVLSVEESKVANLLERFTFRAAVLVLENHAAGLPSEQAIRRLVTTLAKDLSGAVPVFRSEVRLVGIYAPEDGLKLKIGSAKYSLRRPTAGRGVAYLPPVRRAACCAASSCWSHSHCSQRWNSIRPASRVRCSRQ